MRGHIPGRRFIGSIWNKLSSGCIPTITSDGYKVYRPEILAHFHEIERAPYSGRGRPPIEHDVPIKGLRYGQVVKTRNGRKTEVVEYRSVYGNVPSALLNTSCVERMNLSMRNSMARLKRRCITFSKSEPMLQHAPDSFRAIYNFCRPHGSLGRTANSINKHVTPAMSIGMTDHVWSLHELLAYPYRQNTHYKL